MDPVRLIEHSDPSRHASRWITPEDPAFVEDLVPQGVPDSLYKPFSPCYFRIIARHRTLSHRGQHERIASISAAGEGLLGQQWYRGTERRQERVDLGSGRGEERADPGSGRRRNADAGGTRIPPGSGSRRNADWLGQDWLRTTRQREIPEKGRNIEI